MDLGSRRLEDKLATPRYNDPARARTRNLPAEAQKTRRCESSEQESLSDNDDTVRHRDRDHWRYKDTAREVIMSRSRPTYESISQQPSRYPETRHAYRDHTMARHASTGTTNVIPATGSQPSFRQDPGAFRSTLDPVARRFLAIELDDHDGCYAYMRRNAELLSTGPGPFLTEAARALKVRQEPDAKKCLWKALLIHFCENLSGRERRDFFNDLEEEGQQYKKFELAFTEAWAELQTKVRKITPAVSSSAEVPTTTQSRGQSQVLPFTPPTLELRHEAFQRDGLLNARMPVHPTSRANQEQCAKPTRTTPAVVTESETASYFEMFVQLLTRKRNEAIKEAKQSSNEEAPSRPQKHRHPSLRRTPTFGTQWIDFYAPGARSNWPIEGWPYIPTLAFLDSGSLGNVNSVSKEYLEEKLNMTYQSTDDRIRGHEHSFTPLGIVKIEFHPVDMNESGECEADLPVTLSFYVHNENDLFGQILLGREYMRSRTAKIGLPTYKDTMKLNPEEQKVANEKITKRDAASQRVWDAKNNGNSPSGHNGSNPARQQVINRLG